MDAALASTLALMSVVGLALGVFGGGGSILAVPVLVYVAGVAPSTAIGMSLAIVGVTSLVASLAHQRRGAVDHRVAALFGGAGIATAYLAAKLTHLASERGLMLAFAVMMLGVGAWMLVGRRQPIAAAASSRLRPAAALIAGAAVGAVTGFLGVGGGFLVVPALIGFARLDMRKAVGTSLVVVAINSAAGFLGHGGSGMPYSLLVALTAVATLGAVIGERAARRVAVAQLRTGFALLVVVVGIAVAAATAS